MPCPYGCGALAFRDVKDSVNVIGHDHERVQLDAGEMAGNVIPARLNQFATFVQPYLTAGHLPEQAFPTVRADRHEIRAGLRVVVPFQPNGLAMPPLGIAPHVWSTAPPALP